ncbi:MAG: hypothetical protein HLUCCO18_11540 [Rhodobacteraceae bacterium HLUCCO18]|nr:MAG: hypothetical protein HLUCCO18_11540 [Rhodobacteraceae bacterium HLUCCO18]
MKDGHAEDIAAEGLLPVWLRDISGPAGGTGFYEKTGEHAAAFVDRGRHQLVVSFDNLADAGNPGHDVEPWGGKFIRDKGWSHLGVFARGPSWYRDPEIIGLFDRLARRGFFDSFDRVALVGTSMGGFAALAFADFAPGSTVVALSPQTTLDRTRVPWEERFLKGQARDWTLPCSDAAHTIGRIDRAYILYDPAVKADLWHVERLPQDRVIRLKGFWFGHKTAVVMRRIDQLKPFMEAAVTGTLTEPAFYRMIRARKDLLLYRREVEADLTRRGQKVRMKRFRDAFRNRKRRLANVLAEG